MADYGKSTSAIDAVTGALDMKGPSKRRRKKRSDDLYTKGEKNYIIDSAIHPLANKHPLFIIVDECLHVIVEQNLPVSAQKFVRYSLPEILKTVTKGR